jgi:SsrA-binding protein
MTREEEVEEKNVVTNRRARHEYFVLESYEAGLALKGTEVKSLRAGSANLQDGYVMVRRAELWLVGMHINPFEQGNINNHDPLRDRKLLLHAKEIRKLTAKLQEKGLALIPLRVYFKRNLAKVEIGLCKGKKFFDKRETIKKRDVERQLQRDFAKS